MKQLTVFRGFHGFLFYPTSAPAESAPPLLFSFPFKTQNKTPVETENYNNTKHLKVRFKKSAVTNGVVPFRDRAFKTVVCALCWS